MPFAPPIAPRRSPALFAVLLGTVLHIGCASYQMGSDTLYASDVQTIYVPMIESDSYRRDLGERLTEAIVREIQLKSPFQVVGSPDADAVLSVRLTTDSRRVLIEDQFDAPRALENQIFAEVTYINRRRVPLLPPTPVVVDVPPSLLQAAEAGVQVPVLGQSVASSQQQAIERLAQQIVGSMEEPW